MRDQQIHPLEREIAERLEPSTSEMFFEHYDVSAYLLSGTSYRPSIPAYSIPWLSGNRSAAQQNALFLKGLSRADGYIKKSFHQSGRAYHLGPRNILTNAFVRFGSGDPEADQLFLLMVEKGRQLGMECGFDWPTFPDYHHFENRAASGQHPPAALGGPEDLGDDTERGPA